MKLWLDDQVNDASAPGRHAPIGWSGCSTAMQARRLIKQGKVTVISLDHDLGENVLGNGYTVVRFIEKLVFEGKIDCPAWEIHSANPVGRKNMVLGMISAERIFYSRKNKCTPS